MDLFSYLLGKKASGSKGTNVIANPELVGDEDNLVGLQVGNTKYKVTEANANPTLAGTEAELTGLEVDGTKYKIDTLEHYSTDEHVVGTWTNGKPLYEKTIIETAPHVINSGTEVQKRDLISSDSTDFAFIVSGLLKYNTSPHSVWTMPYYNNSFHYIKSLVTILDDSGKYSYVIASNDTLFNDGTVYLTVRYTKTAD